MKDAHYEVEYEIAESKCSRVCFSFQDLLDAFDFARNLETESSVILVERESETRWIETLIAEVTGRA